MRNATYVGLLKQDLIRTKRLAADGTRPPLVPIVLYNGEPLRGAGLSVEPVYHAVAWPLASFRLGQRYPVLDEIRIAEPGNLPQRNLSATLFQVEASRTPEQVRKLITALIQWLASPEQADLRRAFTIWLSRVFLPRRMPSAEVPTIHDLHGASKIFSLDESREAQWERRGLEKGRVDERRLPTGQARHRFANEIATRSAELLALISDPLTLEDLGEQLLDSADPEGLACGIGTGGEARDPNRRGAAFRISGNSPVKSLSPPRCLAESVSPPAADRLASRRSPMLYRPAWSPAAALFGTGADRSRSGTWPA